MNVPTADRLFALRARLRRGPISDADRAYLQRVVDLQLAAIKAQEDAAFGPPAHAVRRAVIRSLIGCPTPADEETLRLCLAHARALQSLRSTHADNHAN